MDRRFALALVGAVVLATGADPAAAAPWCSVQNNVASCGFYTFEQCRQAISGAGGRCERNLAEPIAQPVPPKARPPARQPDAASRPPAPPAQPPAPPAAPQQQASFPAARAMLLSGQYEPALAALRALGRDDDPDVAASIGYASLRLGRLDEASTWLGRALAADPRHLGALHDSGLLRLRENDVAGARETLVRVQAVCGPTCRESVELERAIARHPEAP